MRRTVKQNAASVGIRSGAKITGNHRVGFSGRDHTAKLADNASGDGRPHFERNCDPCIFKGKKREIEPVKGYVLNTVDGRLDNELWQAWLAVGQRAHRNLFRCPRSLEVIAAACRKTGSCFFTDRELGERTGRAARTATDDIAVGVALGLWITKRERPGPSKPHRRRIYLALPENVAVYETDHYADGSRTITQTGIPKNVMISRAAYSEGGSPELPPIEAYDSGSWEPVSSCEALDDEPARSKAESNPSSRSAKTIAADGAIVTVQRPAAFVPAARRLNPPDSESAHARKEPRT